MGILTAREDDRDIDQLLGFIEGEDGKEKKDKSERKKKRKKKKVAAEQPAAGEKSNVRPEEQASTEEVALGIDALEIIHSSLKPTKPDNQGTGIKVKKEAKAQSKAGKKSKVGRNRKTSTEEAASSHDSSE